MGEEPDGSAVYDLAIVGGGIVGTALAYYAAVEGLGRIVLLERELLGSGSTGGSFGGVRQQFNERDEVVLARRGLEFWKSVESRFGVPCPFHEDGYLFLTAREETAGRLRLAAELQRANGLPEVHLLGGPQVAEIAPWLDTAGILTGSWTPHDGHVVPTDGMLAFASAARRLGVVISERSPVTGLSKRRGSWLVDGPNRVLADRVVVAAGYWSPELVRPFGADIPVRGVPQHTAITEPCFPDLKVPLTVDLDTGLVVERQGRSLALSVLSIENPRVAASRESMMDEVVRLASRRAPALLDLKIVTFISPVPAVGGDGMPYAGEIADGLWLLTFAGHGAMLGPPMAQLLVRAMERRDDPEVALARFDPFRKVLPSTVWWRRAEE
jgi:sarcosine oxidase subunit beta